MMTPHALKMTGCGVSFGGIAALSDVHLCLRPGEVHGLIGPNGAGKSTCINVLSGFLKIDDGSVSFGSYSLEKADPPSIRRAGISRTFQSGRLFGSLSVAENLIAAAIGIGMTRSHADAEANAILAWMNLQHLSGRSADALPYTDQRRVAIARSLVGHPAYLLLDEPAAGMSADEVADFADLIRRMNREKGVSILLVEHNVAVVFDVCDTITVLDGGRVIASGDPHSVWNDEKVKQAYTGSTSSAQPSGSVEL